MLQSLLVPALLIISTSSSASANSYRISETIIGKDFYLQLEGPWYCGSSTRTRVNSLFLISLFINKKALCCRSYVDQQTSIDKNLTYASSNAFVLRTDYHTVLHPNGPGRNSVRIKSNSAYGDHVVV